MTNQQPPFCPVLGLSPLDWKQKLSGARQVLDLVILHIRRALAQLLNHNTIRVKLYETGVYFNLEIQGATRYLPMWASFLLSKFPMRLRGHQCEQGRGHHFIVMDLNNMLVITYTPSPASHYPIYLDNNPFTPALSM